MPGSIFPISLLIALRGNATMRIQNHTIVRYRRSDLRPWNAAIGRRSLLQLAAASGPSLWLAGCACPPPTPPLPPLTGDGIDVHAHVFNARDLPIPGFLVQIILEEFRPENELVAPLAVFLALVLQSVAPSAQEELRWLNDGRVIATPPSLYERALGATRRMQAARPDVDLQHVVLAVRAFMRRQGCTPTKLSETARGLGSDARLAPALVSQFLGTLARLQPGIPLRGLSPPGQQPQLTGDELARAAAAGVERNASNNSGIFYLGWLLMQARFRLVRLLAELPRPADQGQVALFTPALIDFTYWLHEWELTDPLNRDLGLEPPDTTPLKEQIAVMSRIASNPPIPDAANLPAVHPFVSFCPWREIVDRYANRRPTQFDLVRQAIEKQGFIGVKIYPPMGFRPTGNVGQPECLYPSRLQCYPNFRKQLDDVLSEVYCWCADPGNDVPVMAHCAFSIYPSKEVGRLAGPQGWLDVLKGHPNLRLNLAHAGGVWDLEEGASGAGVGWPEIVMKTLNSGTYPNLYSDFADFGEMLECGSPEGPKGSAVRRLAGLLDLYHGAQRKVMYGTDYPFLIRTAHTENFLSAARCLAREAHMSPTDLLAGNAARFLGLADRASGTRKRLDEFRKHDNYLRRFEKFAPKPAHSIA